MIFSKTSTLCALAALLCLLSCSLALADAVRIVLALTLGLLGVSAPERM